MFPGRRAASFDEPVEMLLACHERIEGQLGTLERLVKHLPAKGCDDAARQAAEAVMRYFDRAAIDHHLDEEEDLFPLLHHAAAELARDEVGAALYEVEREHATLDRLYSRVREQLQAIALGRSDRLDSETLGRMAALYRSHMATEEAVLLPFARETLTPEQRAALGARMAARRGAARMAPG